MGKEGGSSSWARLAFLFPLPSQSRVSSSSRVLTSFGRQPGSTLAVARVSSLSGGALLSGFPAKTRGSCHSHLGAGWAVQLLPTFFLFGLKDSGQGGSLPASLRNFHP